MGRHGGGSLVLLVHLDCPEQARFRLFDSITTFLKTASQRQPLVLVLDDLHWADQPTLMLLQFVARELGSSRLMVIGTYRDVKLSRPMSTPTAPGNGVLCNDNATHCSADTHVSIGTRARPRAMSAETPENRKAGTAIGNSAAATARPTFPDPA